MQGGRVVITKHDAPTAVLLSYDEYQDLTGADSPDLDALSHEFDELMARMQTPASREATEALFRASTAELAEAAVAEARRDARSPERG
jgi:PHD/YefM family antitoxin component YafN of YafNO toxin-antitoxin module